MSPDYLVDQILRQRSINLIAGPVGAGKTTLLFQLIEAISLGRKFMGFPVRQGKVAYVPLDRDRAETMETLNRVQFSGSLDIFPADEMPNIAVEIPKLENLISTYSPHYALVVFEPLDYLLRDSLNRTGNPNDKMQVFQFLLKARRALAKSNSVVLGSMHTAKCRDDSSRYANARERISGTTAWTANTSTTILVEPLKPSDDMNPFRLVTFLLRNAPNLAVDARLDEETGRLVPVTIPDKYLDVYTEISQASGGTEFSTIDLQRWADSIPVHPRSVRRFLDSLIERGELLDGGQGKWIRGRIT